MNDEYESSRYADDLDPVSPPDVGFEDAAPRPRSIDALALAKSRAKAKAARAARKKTRRGR